MKTPLSIKILICYTPENFEKGNYYLVGYLSLLITQLHQQ